MQYSVLKEESFAFALRILKWFRNLSEENRQSPLFQQLLERGTRVGALIRRVDHSQADADFVHHLSLAERECNETIFLLELLQEAGYLSLLDQQIHAAAAETILKGIVANIKSV